MSVGIRKGYLTYEEVQYLLLYHCFELLKTSCKYLSTPSTWLSRPEAEQVNSGENSTFRWITAQLGKDAKAAGVQEQGRDTERMMYTICHVLCKKISELKAEFPEPTEKRYTFA